VVKQEHYTRRAVADALTAGRRARPHQLLLQPLREWRRRFITLGGYRDGWVGLLLASLLAYYELRFQLALLWAGRAQPAGAGG
jgi:hypothetical protein